MGLDKISEGTLENPLSVDAVSSQNDKPKNEFYKENPSDQEYEYSSSSVDSEESAEDIFEDPEGANN